MEGSEIRTNLQTPNLNLGNFKGKGELLPNFFRVAYCYKFIIEDNLKKITLCKQKFFEQLKIKITKQQVIILLRLSITDNLLVKELGNSLNIQLSNLSNQIDRLEDKGLVLKKSKTEDARVKIVEITNKAIGVIQTLPESLDIKYINHLNSMNKTQSEEFLSIFKTILDDIKTEMPEIYNAVYSYT